MSISKYINLIGVECEGLWLNIPGCQGYHVMNNDRIITDSSVIINKIPKKFTEKLKAAQYAGELSQFSRSGEVVSRPFGNLQQLIESIYQIWPDVTNSTCGAHIHFSLLDDSYYSCLMEPGFYDWFKLRLYDFSAKQKLDKKKCFADRVFNRTERSQYYCKDEFIPLKQAYVTNKIYRTQNGDRYTFLNYCFSRLSTIECRVFSAHITIPQFINCINWLIETVDSYLNNFYEEFCAKQLAQVEVELEVEEGVKDIRKKEGEHKKNGNNLINNESLDLILEPGN